MGIFKDLGFINQDNILTVPDTQLFDGNTIDDLYNSVLPPQLPLQVDTAITIPGTSLPYVATQELIQTPWREYQVIATSLSSGAQILVNGIVQQVLSVSGITTTFTPQYTSTRELDVSATNGTVASVKLNLWDTI